MKNQKHGPQNQGKPYLTPPKQYGNRPNNQRIAATRFSSGNGTKPITFSTRIICYKCGKLGHISSNCVDKDINC